MCVDERERVVCVWEWGVGRGTVTYIPAGAPFCLEADMDMCVRVPVVRTFLSQHLLWS